MSGIYIHIPFCKKACHYCNFHFSTSLRLKDELLDALCKEIEIRKEFLDKETIDTIYLGGGTPSILDERDLDKIFETIYKIYSINDNAEITLEANPDDINRSSLKAYKDIGINRLSIGIQSFFDTDLQWMNRAHTAHEAYDSVWLSQEAGFENITIDLIYGCPTTTNNMWLENIQKSLSLNLPHISAYCLTVEEKTALHHFIAKNKVPAPDQDSAVAQFEFLVKSLTAHGYLHYEISNFAKPGYISVHNSNYWKGHHYIGIGPSAHSYDGIKRCWNVANNKKYIDAIQNDNYNPEIEVLTPEMNYNEYIMTSLRTMWGTDINRIKTLNKTFVNYFEQGIELYMSNGLVIRDGDYYRLSEKGKHFADRIAMDLFYVI